LDEGNWRVLWKYDFRVVSQFLFFFYERLLLPCISEKVIEEIDHLMKEKYNTDENFNQIFTDHNFL
jgi:hypothetical protein